MRTGQVFASGVLAAVVALGGCDDTREAEAETDVAEAEVETEAPESVIPDEQLDAAAQVGAELATPPDAVAVPVPVPVPADTAAAGTTNQNSQSEPQNTPR